MTRIPNFADVAFKPTAAAPAAPANDAEPWMTPEGIPVKPAYGPADIEGLSTESEGEGRKRRRRKR